MNPLTLRIDFFCNKFIGIGEKYMKNQTQRVLMLTTQIFCWLFLFKTATTQTFITLLNILKNS